MHRSGTTFAATPPLTIETWGNETSLNTYSYCKHVVLVGILHRDLSELEAQYLGQIDNLMKTATFNVVGFHKVTDDRYEIERPGSPYHVLLRSGYALFGEEVAAMQALRVTPDQLTKPLRDKYDVVLTLDLRQVPRASKELWVDELKNQFEP